MSNPVDTTDRRIARTRAHLHRALMSLVIARGYDDLSVQDICDAADVGRSTFYAHYTGKDDLKRSGLSHLKAALAHARSGRPLSFTAALFAHGRDHLDLYRALHGGPGADVSLVAIRDMLSELIDEDFRTAGIGGDRHDRTLAVRFAVGALMAVLTGWLDNGAQTPPDVIDAQFHRLLEKGLAS